MGRFYIPQNQSAAEVSAPVIELDYDKQPLPLVGVFSNYGNSPDCSVYDSDLNLVSRMTQASGGNAWPTSGEIWSDYTGVNYTNGNFSSNGAGNSYWIKATVMTQADGHQMMRLSSNGTLAARQADSAGTLQQRFGVVIGPKGYRQPMSLWCQGSTLRQHARGGPVHLDQLTTSLNSASAGTWYGQSTGYGMVGYHREAGILAILEPKDGSCNYRLHIWKHPKAKLSGKPGELNTFILEAKAGSNGASYQYTDFNWSANSSTSYSESQYRMRVIPTASGKIALARFVPHNGAYMAVFDPATGQLDTNFNGVGCTTSYGMEQGSYYGMRHQITWDNQWVATFAPYYYYGSGISGHVINTHDPYKRYRLSYSDSSSGVTLIPVRESGFAYSLNSSNADSSQGLQMGIMDFSTPGFMPYGAASNDAALSFNTWAYFIDTGYTSTNYPCLLPVENWHI